MVAAEQPGAGSHDHVQPPAGERGHRAVERVGAEQPARAVVASLVRVERRLHHLIQRVGGVELDATDDREGDQDGAAGSGAGRDEPVQLLGGQHVQEGGRRDQAGARELLRVEPGDVAPTRLEGERARPAGTVGGSAGASASSSTSRSYSTQCWAPGSCGASQRAIDPLPDPGRGRRGLARRRGGTVATRPARPSGPRRRRAPAGSASLRWPGPVRWSCRVSSQPDRVPGPPAGEPNARANRRRKCRRPSTVVVALSRGRGAWSGSESACREAWLP